MRYVIGNVVFGIIATAWAVHFRSDVEVATAGVAIVLVSFIAGTCIGAALHGRRRMSPQRACSARHTGCAIFVPLFASAPLFVFSLGCDKPATVAPNPIKQPGPTSEQLTVSGDVSREMFMNPVATFTGGGAAYHVELSVQNSGTSRFTFDYIQAGFVPANGKTLGIAIETVEGEESDQTRKPVTLQPGETRTYELTSNGYTGELLANSGGKPLVLTLEFIRDKAAAATFAAPLPHIGQLPQYEVMRMARREGAPDDGTRPVNVRFRSIADGPPPPEAPAEGDVRAAAGIKDAAGGLIPIHENPPPAEGWPQEFFPMEAGARWSYAITVGKVKPARYAVKTWPLGDRAVAYANRGYFRGIFDDKRPNRFKLAYSVKGPAAIQGRLRYPIGVELSVDVDELGVFEGAKQSFWATTNARRTSVLLIQVHDGRESPAPSGFGGWGEDGHSMRTAFYADASGTSTEMDGSGDSLLYAGIDRTVAGFDGTDCMHLIRQVKASGEREAREAFEKFIREDMWFVRGRGLVRLVQRIDDEVSMTWELESFQPGGKERRARFRPSPSNTPITGPTGGVTSAPPLGAAHDMTAAPRAPPIDPFVPEVSR